MPIYNAVKLEELMQLQLYDFIDIIIPCTNISAIYINKLSTIHKKSNGKKNKITFLIKTKDVGITKTPKVCKQGQKFNIHVGSKIKQTTSI